MSAAVFEYTSQAFPIVSQQLAGITRPYILDLGPPAMKSVAFFSQYAARLHIEDLRSAILEGPSAHPLAVDELCEALENGAQSPKFDLILCWDLLNYLSRVELERLLSAIGSRAHDATHLLVLAPSGKRIPKAPAKFSIEAEDKVIMEISDDSELQEGGVTQGTLKQLVPRLENRRSLLLRNGYQEQLYTFSA